MELKGSSDDDDNSSNTCPPPVEQCHSRSYATRLLRGEALVVVNVSRHAADLAQLRDALIPLLVLRSPLLEQLRPIDTSIAHSDAAAPHRVHRDNKQKAYQLLVLLNLGDLRAHVLAALRRGVHLALQRLQRLRHLVHLAGCGVQSLRQSRLLLHSAAATRRLCTRNGARRVVASKHVPPLRPSSRVQPEPAHRPLPRLQSRHAQASAPLAQTLSHTTW
jgi:hypothetical protein